MKRIKCQVAHFVAGFALVIGATAQVPSQSLVWDATSKFYLAKRGDTNVLLIFNLTNVSSWIDAEVNGLSTSCGCTVAKMPPTPWRLPTGATGKIEVHVDLRGKQGLLTKMLTVATSCGGYQLAVNVDIPPPDPLETKRMTAHGVMQPDHQAVFRFDCARCHAEPAAGKNGQELYDAACGICHEASHRPEMVPNLSFLKNPTDKEYWSQWVRQGKPGTLMPGFSKSVGGPLTEDQILSLVEYLTNRFRQNGIPEPQKPATANSVITQ